MAAERPGQTVIDYVTIVLSPALIIGLISSLVFFLLEVFYRTEGAFKERLQWILFFYVFGAVLNARVAIEGNASPLAPLYAPALALLTFIGMQTFVEYPPGVQMWNWLVNLFLIGVVWWCSQKLTWDCTNVDEEVDMSAEGLLQASGLQERPGASTQEESIEAELEGERPLSWFERYRRYQEQKSKKRVLGVWVVYFSLAALPLFGLGQSLIPLQDAARRRFAFLCLLVYVACGLGLLLTTCFLGLRHYLRQKRLQMPAAMTGAWLLTGGTIAAALLVIALVLPRPYPEVPIVAWLVSLDSQKQKASQYAMKGDSPAEGKGQPGQSKQQDPGEKQAGKGKADGKDADGKSQQSQEKNGRAQGKDGKGEGKDGKSEGKDGKGESKSGKQDAQAQNKQKSQDQQAGKDRSQSKEEQQGSSGSNPNPPSTNALQQLLQRLAPILKWIVFAILALLVVMALLRAGVGFLANFTDWARRLLQAWRDFWARWFPAPQSGETQTEEEEGDESEPFAPFSDFINPFDSGQASRMSSRRLVRYSFAALEAWARDRDLPRRPEETALEFTTRLGEEVPALQSQALSLADLLARAEYAPGELPGNTAERVKFFWDRLSRLQTGSLSA